MVFINFKKKNGYKENNLKKYPTIQAREYCLSFARQYNPNIADEFVEPYFDVVILQFDKEKLVNSIPSKHCKFECVDALYDEPWEDAKRSETEDRLYSDIPEIKITPDVIDGIYVTKNVINFYANYKFDKQIPSNRVDVFPSQDKLSTDDIFNHFTKIFKLAQKHNIPLFYLKDETYHYGLQNAKRIDYKTLLDRRPKLIKGNREDVSFTNKTNFNGDLV